MQGRFAVLGVAVFVLVDAVLIGFAVYHVDRTPASSTVVVTRIITTTSLGQSTTSAAGPPAESAATSTSASLSGPTSSHLAGTAPAAPTTVKGGASTKSATSTSASAATTTATTASRLLLSMSSDGTVLRATVGDCKAGKPAIVELSTDRGQSFKSVGGDVRQVLRVTARMGGNVWFVATGQDCAPKMHQAANFAVAMPIGGNDGTWYPATGASSTTVNAPGGPVDAGCIPIGMSPIDAKAPFILCTDGRIRATTNAGASWQTRSTVVGGVSISFTDKSSGFLLAAQPECAVAVMVTTDGAATWQQRACLHGSVPQAIATAGSRMLAMVDGVLQGSADAGVSWAPVP